MVRPRSSRLAMPAVRKSRSRIRTSPFGTVNSGRLLSQVPLSLRRRSVDGFGVADSQFLKSFAKSARSGIVEPCRFFVAVEDDQSEMRNNYVTLLASMMDRDRQKDVHPAFPKLLRELSPLDALLLQITPYGSEVRLPNGFEKPTYKFSSGLVATWETWQEQGQTVGKYRFFCQIKKRPLEENGKTVGIKKSDEHMGFVEFELEQSQLFRDKGLGWHNLQRLGLVSEHRENDLSGKRVELFYRDPEALRQIKGISRNPDLFFGQLMYYRTELGRAFAKCCTPVYTGEQIWHSSVHE